MIKLMKFFRWQEWLVGVITLLLLIAQIYCSLTLPEYMGEIIGDLQAGAMAENLNMYWGDILRTAGIMLALVVATIIANIAVNYCSSFIVSSLGARLRRDLFKNVNDFSMAEINKFSIPSLITRSTNDLTQIQQVYHMFITMGLTAPITAIVAIIKIIKYSTTLSWVTAVSVVILLLIVALVFLLIVPKFSKTQKLTDRLNLVARENLTGLRVVRASRAENFEEAKFDKANKDLAKVNLFVNKIASLIQPSISMIMSGTSLAIIWIGAYLIKGGSIDYETLTKFTQYSSQIIMSFMMLSIIFVMTPRGIVSAKRVNEVLKTKSSVLDGKGAIPEEKGTVEFKNVSFKYPGADDYVLQDISFTAKQGETIAFIGSTGSGKSTLINLVPRFYDATDGEVFIDGINVKDYKLEELESKLGYVPQKATLFSGTVKENLTYGNENISDEELNQAIRISQSSFVHRYKDGLEHKIAQGGKNVSGGQKQRLSIARAIAKNPEIFIFDDSFSALDYKTDRTLRKELSTKLNDKTKLIVAQRIGTIKDADKIIVLNEGKMVGCGKHNELLENCDVYKEIALSQLSEEELKNGKN